MLANDDDNDGYDVIEDARRSDRDKKWKQEEKTLKNENCKE